MATQKILQHRTSGEKMTARIVGNALIIVFTILPYVIGAVMAQSDNFYKRTAINFVLAAFGVQYFSAAIVGALIFLIIYNVVFSIIDGRSENEYSCYPVEGKSMIDNIWIPWGLISAVICFIGVFITYWIAFKGIMVLVKPLMLWVWIAQIILCLVTFFIPLCHPMKKV